MTAAVAVPVKMPADSPDNTRADQQHRHRVGDQENRRAGQREHHAGQQHRPPADRVGPPAERQQCEKHAARIRRIDHGGRQHRKVHLLAYSAYIGVGNVVPTMMAAKAYASRPKARRVFVEVSGTLKNSDPGCDLIPPRRAVAMRDFTSVRGDRLLRADAGQRPHLEFGVDLRVTSVGRRQRADDAEDERQRNRHDARIGQREPGEVHAAAASPSSHPTPRGRRRSARSSRSGRRTCSTARRGC